MPVQVVVMWEGKGWMQTAAAVAAAAAAAAAAPPLLTAVEVGVVWRRAGQVEAERAVVQHLGLVAHDRHLVQRGLAADRRPRPRGWVGARIQTRVGSAGGQEQTRIISVVTGDCPNNHHRHDHHWHWQL